MVDYVPVLTRAIEALNPNTSELRHVLYDRARKALIDKFRASDPSLSSTDLTAESAMLEAAIRRVEVDAARRGAAPQPKPKYETYDVPVEEYHDRPPLKDIQKRLRIVAGAFGAMVILVAGMAAYSVWPRILSSARSTLSPKSVNTAAERPSANTGYIYLRQLVYYRTNQPVGTIIVDKSQTFLYVVRPSVSALRYSIGLGPECTTLAGLYHVVRKEKGSGGNPPTQQSTVRALYLNNDNRIHATNVRPTTGQGLPKGCIGLVNDDVIYLYDRTPLESRVVVLN
jgi:lipoprotein-anchoring transpeptidase ErfK/SrfK